MQTNEGIDLDDEKIGVSTHSSPIESDVVASSDFGSSSDGKNKVW